MSTSATPERIHLAATGEEIARATPAERKKRLEEAALTLLGLVTPGTQIRIIVEDRPLRLLGKDGKPPAAATHLLVVSRPSAEADVRIP
jgi:hypothetical protein